MGNALFPSLAESLVAAPCERVGETIAIPGTLEKRYRAWKNENLGIATGTPMPVFTAGIALMKL